MPIELTPIAGSSQLDSAGYDSGTNELHVRFESGGKTYVYQGVEPGIAADFQQAESMGRFLSENIRTRYEFTVVDDTEGGAE